MGTILNSAGTIALILVSGFIGYKIGDFSLSDIYKEKLEEELAKSNKAATFAQKEHTKEIENINKLHKIELEKIKENYSSEKVVFEQLLKDKDKKILKLNVLIDSKTKELESKKQDLTSFKKQKEVLERNLSQQEFLSNEDKKKLAVATQNLEKSKEKVAQLEKDILSAKEQKEGMECLDKYEPINKGV